MAEERHSTQQGTPCNRLKFFYTLGFIQAPLKVYTRPDNLWVVEEHTNSWDFT